MGVCDLQGPQREPVQVQWCQQIKFEMFGCVVYEIIVLPCKAS